MSDGFPDRLTQLRARWQGDPSSRIFLQLAEEYRHLGRVQDALGVLEAGLREHPGYLSALVAKGRCLLELGKAEGAREVLERVVQQDATQMVANKLLVRAYLETGDPERARQRLDLYSLLNDSDPEIEELSQRVVAMSRPPQATDGPRPEEPAERSRMEPGETRQGATDARAPDVFDLGPAAPVRSFAAADDLFGLGPPPPEGQAQAAEPPPAPELSQDSETAGRSQPAEGPEPAAGPVQLAPRGEGTGIEPFPDLAPERSRALYLASLVAERIFWFDGLDAVAAPLPPPAAPAPPPEAALAPAAAPVPEPAVPVAAAPVAAPAEEAEAAVAAAAAPEATVTLGELYLRQGHLVEAESIFRQVIEREPANAAAHQGLSQLALSGAAARPPLDARQLLAGMNDPQAAPPASRKVYLLHSYLARLRQARRPHVP
jgi:tetratricopeptide (TPR) repeat protein